MMRVPGSAVDVTDTVASEVPVFVALMVQVVVPPTAIDDGSQTEVRVVAPCLALKATGIRVVGAPAATQRMSPKY